MDFFIDIAKQFNLATITDASLLTNGKTASTYLLHTNAIQKFILKSIETKEQAYFEYELNQHIRAKNKTIVSEILTTKYDKPFIQIGGNLFQLQIYVPTMNEKAPLQDVLKAYRMLQNYFEDFQYEKARQNRFNLDMLWRDTKELLHENFQMIYDEIKISIEQLQVLDNNQTSWIHGDLGAWNLLFTTEQNVCFIDFSEARKGPKYFDLVAIFASHSPQNLEKFDTYIQEFFELFATPVNLKEFYLTLELWYVKGILSLMKIDTQSTKEHVLNLYQILKYVRSL